MAALPDKILADEEIGAFIDRVNTTADEIIGDSKFEIPNQNLFGLGLLMKLQIGIFEKSIASSFAPIFLGKKALSGGLKELKDAVNSIKTLIQNPLQFVIDEGVNKPLEDFPFPVYLSLEGTQGSVGALKSLIASAGPDSIENDLEKYNYKLGFSSASVPSDGEILTSSSSLGDIRNIRVSTITDNSETNNILRLVTSGDNIELSDGTNYGSFRIVTSSVVSNSDSSYYNLELQKISVNEEQNPQNSEISIPGFSNAELRSSRRINLRDYIRDGVLSIPFAALGLNVPLLDKINLVIGDFSKVSSDSPTAKYLEDLSVRSGLEFGDVVAGVMEGKFPNIDFGKLQETTANGNPDLKESSREDLVAFSRMIQIGADNPFFLIKILLNYLKLILLPIKVVVGVLKGLASKITNPVSLIRTVIKGLTDPLGLICDLISEAFLTFLEPYISPYVTVVMPYQDAKVDPRDSSRGLRPLISDMVCGSFSKGLADYRPNKDFFDEVRRNLDDELEVDESEIDLTFNYNFSGVLTIPEEGQITANSRNLMDVNVIRVSSISGDVQNALGPLVNVQPGSFINLSVDNDFKKFRVSYRNVKANYIEYGVSKPTTIEYENLSDVEKVISGINENSFAAQLTVDNPNKTLLYIIEKYLPLKLIAIWESIKGIIAIFASLAAEVPSLLPAIIRSLFNLNGGISLQERVNRIESGYESPNTTISAIVDVLDLLTLSEFSSLLYKGTGERRWDNTAITTASSLIFGSSPEDSIETYFYDLQNQLDSLDLDKSAKRSKLSTSLSVTPSNLGKSSYYNTARSNNKYEYPTSMPSRNNFYYGEYSVNDIGKSVKVLMAVLYNLRRINYFENNRINLTKRNITVKISRPDGSGEDVVATTLRNAIVGYKVTNTNVDEVIRVKNIRALVNRELWFIANYLLPSLED